MSGYNALQALGDMAKAGGSYYGVLAQEQLRSQRMKEAREYDEKKTADTRAHAKTVRDEDRKYREGVLADERKYREGQEAKKLATAKDEKASQTSHDTYYTVDGKPVTVSFDGYGNPTNVSPEELKTLSTDRPSKSSKSGSGGSLTEKQYQMRYKDAQAALGQMEALEEEGYDPTHTPSRIADNIATSSSFTNWAASEEGQAYKAASTKLVEAFLRTATGAAAPEPEQARYFYMLTPQAGDSAATVAAKRKLVNDSLLSLGEAAGLTPEQRSNAFRSMVDKAAVEGGFAPKTKMVRGKTYEKVNGNWYLVGG